MSEATPETEYLTEKDCRDAMGFSARMFLFALSLIPAVAVLFPAKSGSIGGCVGLGVQPLLWLIVAWETQQKIRRGEKIPKKQSGYKTARELNSAKIIVPGLALGLSLLGLWFSAFRLLPVVVHTHLVSHLIAALYLQSLLVFCLGYFWKLTIPLLRMRFVVSPSEVPVAAQTASCAESVPITAKSPHWWTESGTRDEVRRQPLGRR